MYEPTVLMRILIMECAEKCSTESWSKDVITLSERVRHEGLSFLTISLPNFSEDFFLALERKKVTSDLFLGWKKRLCLPAFLQGFTKLVFDQHTGDLLYEPLVEAIASIRQICNLFKKVSLLCSSERTIRALKKYTDVDQGLGSLPILNAERDLSIFEEVSRYVISTICGDEVRDEDLVPHHGPGSTAEGMTGNGKYVVRNLKWYAHLEPAFSQTMLYSSEECQFNDAEEVAETSLESTVKVITVPKTLKAPRTIAMEPTVMQMAQQSLKDYLVERIESNPLTRGHVNFTDQRINQRMALMSSLNGRYATLDMSDASDRVHKDLVWRMFSVNPGLRERIFSCRSPKAYVDGCEITLNKFASMGSALCFPTMALYFTIILVIAILDRRGLTVTPAHIKRAMRDIYIFGDDIIVPVDEVDTVVTTLTKFGNVVGSRKSFWLGSFRESCGVDAYKGVNITPVYLRQLTYDRKTMASCMVSSVSFCNQMFQSGRMKTALYVKSCVERVLGKLPQVSEHAEGLGWWFDDEGVIPKKRWNRKLQRLEVRTFVPYTVLKKDCIRGYNALFKCLLLLIMKEKKASLKRYEPKGLASQSMSGDHLNTSVVRGALVLKRRWIASY